VCIEVLAHILQQPKQHQQLRQLAEQLLLDDRLARLTAAAGLRPSDAAMQQQLASHGRLHLWSWISTAPVSQQLPAAAKNQTAAL
jgi:hypothetical protein